MVEVQLEQQLTELGIVLMSASLSQYTFEQVHLRKGCIYDDRLPLVFKIAISYFLNITLCVSICNFVFLSSIKRKWFLQRGSVLIEHCALFAGGRPQSQPLIIIVNREKNFTTFHYCEQREQLYNFGEKILTGGLRSVSCNVLAALVVQYLALFWKHIIIIIFADYHCFVLPKDFQSSLSLSSSRPVSKFLWSFFTGFTERAHKSRVFPDSLISVQVLFTQSGNCLKVI